MANPRPHRFTKEELAAGAKVVNERRTPKERQELARHAVQIRWRRWKKQNARALQEATHAGA